MPQIAEVISKDELKDIQKAYSQLITPLKTKLKGEDEVNLKKAYEIAVDGHKTQRRKSGEPYVLHPIEVARICHEEIGLGPTAVICAILHDVVEDTKYTLEDIQAFFGEKISKIVDGLTKLDGTYNNVDSPQAENFKKVVSSLVYDVRVVLIKMADRLHNLRTIGSMPRHKQLRIAAETSYIYAPLAHRLGLYNIKTEFEDICMKITEPEMYADLEAKVQDSEEQRSKYINEFVKPLNQNIKALNIPYRVLSRSKSIASIANKIKTKNVAFEQIYDLFAVRIIVDVKQEKEKSSCWQIYSVITDVYKPIPERLKDWVTTPKGNGYESLHTTVIGPKGRFVEVQIRSERMDEIAEKGFAAHWKYKDGKPKAGKKKDNVYDYWLDNLRSILDQQHSNAVEFLNDFRSNLFSEEVYVFTPNGDMKILPKGATALDFAFEVHTDIGYRATALKVNDKLVPMGYELQNGDRVHVTTGKNQKPKEDWLKLVVTGKAKSKIRSSMKEERRRKGELGKEALQRKMRNMKVDFEENCDMLVKHFGFNSRPDLYYSLAIDQTKVSELKIFEAQGNKLVLKPVEEDKSKVEFQQIPEKKTKTSPDNKNLIVVNGEPASQYSFTLSKCCNPVPGDDIFAFTSATTGMKIHRTNCPNATHMMANYGYRLLKAEWAGRSDRNFIVDLIVRGVDSGVGVIQKLTNILSNDLDINIRSLSIEGNEGYFEGKLSIMVKNKDQLSIVMKSLKGIEGISTVERIE